MPVFIRRDMFDFLGIADECKEVTIVMRKMLGKITMAEFGVIRDYPFLMGLQLEFKFGDGSMVCDGGKYTVNMSSSCKWTSEKEKHEAIKHVMEMTYDILKDAKVKYVSDLVDIPVEVTLDDNTFHDFRILTEVL